MAGIYKLRGVPELRALAKGLRDHYPEERRKCYALFDRMLELTAKAGLPEEEVKRILTGLCLYVMFSIKSEVKYKLISPEYEEGRVKSTGSKLFSYLREGLGLEKHTMPAHAMAFICLNRFYLFFVRHSRMDAADTALEQDIKAVLKACLSEGILGVNMLLKSPPSLGVLHENASKRLTIYNIRTQNSWWSSIRRTEWVNLIGFLDFVHKTASFYDGAMLTDSSALATADNARRKSKADEDMHRTILASQLFAIRYIESKWLADDLYDITKHDSNPQWVKYLDRATELKYLQALQAFLDSGSLRVLAAERNYDLAQLDKYLGFLKGYISDLTEEKQSAVQSAAKWTVKNMFMFASSQVTAGIGAFVFSNVIGLPVVASFVTGKLVITALQQLVLSRVVPAAEAGLISTALDMMGDAVANATLSVGKALSRLKQDGFMSLMRDETVAQEIKDYMVEYIDELLTLEDDLLSEDYKLKIAEITGRKIPESNHTPIICF